MTQTKFLFNLFLILGIVFLAACGGGGGGGGEEAITYTGKTTQATVTS